MLKAISVKVIESFSFELKPKPQLSNPSESQMYMKSSQKNRQNKEPRLRSRPKFFSDHFSRPKLILIRFLDQNYPWSEFPDQKKSSDQTFQTKCLSDQPFRTVGVVIGPSPRADL